MSTETADEKQQRDAAWEAIRKTHPRLPSSREGWHQHENGGGWVSETANVAAKAMVGPKALVFGGTIRGGTIWCGTIKQTPILICGQRYCIGCSGPGMVSSGCITKPLAWWLEHVERCAEENGYTPEQQREYRLHVEHVAAWMRLYGMDKEEAPAEAKERSDARP